MTDPQDNRLAPLRELAETLDDPRQIALVSAVAALVAEDTALVLEQTHAAQDIAARNRAGAWIGNTELAEILDAAAHYLRRYKRQREEIGGIRAALQARLDAKAQEPGPREPGQ